MKNLLLSVLCIVGLNACATSIPPAAPIAKVAKAEHPSPAVAAKPKPPSSAVLAEQLQIAEIHWKLRGTKNYTYNVRQAYFSCPTTPEGCVSFDVTVQAGKVKSAVAIPVKKPVAVEFQAEAKTIDEFFALIHQLMADKTGGFIEKVEYDPRYGYPTLLSFKHRTRTDSGTIYTLKNLMLKKAKLDKASIAFQNYTACHSLVNYQKKYGENKDWLDFKAACHIHPNFDALTHTHFDAPDKDLLKAIAKGQLHFLGVGGYSCHIPNQISTQDQKYVDKYGVHCFDGNGCVMDSPEHWQLVDELRDYEMVYNAALLEYLNHEPKQMAVGSMVIFHPLGEVTAKPPSR